MADRLFRTYRDAGLGNPGGERREKEGGGGGRCGLIGGEGNDVVQVSVWVLLQMGAIYVEVEALEKSTRMA